MGKQDVCHSVMKPYLWSRTNGCIGMKGYIPLRITYWRPLPGRRWIGVHQPHRATTYCTALSVFFVFFRLIFDCIDTWSLLQARFSERADQNKLSRANLIRKTYNRHGDPSLSSVLPPVLAIVKVFHDIFGVNKLFELNWIEIEVGFHWCWLTFFTMFSWHAANSEPVENTLIAGFCLSSNWGWKTHKPSFLVWVFRITSNI